MQQLPLAVRVVGRWALVRIRVRMLSRGREAVVLRMRMRVGQRMLRV